VIYCFKRHATIIKLLPAVHDNIEKCHAVNIGLVDGMYTDALLPERFGQ